MAKEKATFIRLILFVIALLCSFRRAFASASLDARTDGKNSVSNDGTTDSGTTLFGTDHEPRTVSSSTMPPNIILYMTDDQDVVHQSLDYMPRLKRLFRQEGMEFLHYYVPTGLCCPSRATILRGQYCHNTKVFDNGELSNSTYKSGAWDKFVEEGLEDETFVTLLQSAGYETALIGKYMNGYVGRVATSHVPPGFDHWMGMTNMAFYGPVFSNNGKRYPIDQSVYQTDFIRDQAVDFMTIHRDKAKPFFLMLTPFAPHAPATSAKRHKHMFRDVELPRFDSFNTSDDIQQHRPSWIKDMPPLQEDQIDDMTRFYRNRLRSLQAVDESLESLVESLQQLGLEDNTFFFYTADNGLHFGDFRITAGKRQAYETDVLVPFLVRGPGIVKGTNVSHVVQSVDLGPTFLDLARRRYQQDRTHTEMPPFQRRGQDLTSLRPSYPMDGKSIVDILNGKIPPSPAINDFRWAALLEMYGGSSNIGLRYRRIKGFFQNHMFPNTYQAVRIVNGPGWATGANWLYVEWCTGEQEFYNLTEDPHQVYNLASHSRTTKASKTTITKEAVDSRLLYRLSRLLAWMGDCQGVGCHSLGNEAWSSFKEDGIDGVEGSMGEWETSMLTPLRKTMRNRIQCFNPPNWTAMKDSPAIMELGRKPYSVGLPVPEPFVFGFPFSDGDVVPDELIALWEETYQYYFH